MKKSILLLSLLCFGQIQGQIITTVAGNGVAGFGGDGGQATLAKIDTSFGITIDGANNIYIADTYNQRVRKVSPSGIITTIAGNGTVGYSGDGGLATSAQLNYPDGLAIDASGNLFIADRFNNVIRKVNSSGIISTIAGNGSYGFSGDGGQATLAVLSGARGLAFDAIGNLYFADKNNNRIRMINTSGIITTVVGNGIMGFGGDGGQADTATLNRPLGVFIDTANNLYIGDWGNYRIRKVNTSGIITTIAGNGTAGFSGDGGQATSAELNFPIGVITDAGGNLFIADANNNRIRKVNTSGIITTIAGSGMAGFSGDGGQATLADLNGPSGLSIDAIGNLYFSDQQNNRIRMISNVANGVEHVSFNNSQMTVYPNPTSDQFYIETNATDKLRVDLYDVNGRHVFSASVSNKSNINISTLNEGVYTMAIKTVDRVTNKKLVIAR